jgi:hypothetical protein
LLLALRKRSPRGPEVGHAEQDDGKDREDVIPIPHGGRRDLLFVLKGRGSRFSGFWSPMDSTGVSKSDLAAPGMTGEGAFKLP